MTKPKKGKGFNLMFWDRFFHSIFGKRQISGRLPSFFWQPAPILLLF
jgi:hypothetical protein